MTRTQVLAWVELWSYTDRAGITAALDAIPNGVCVVPPSGGYIGVWTDDQRALVIYPGYLVWPGGRWTKDLPRDLFPDMQRDEHDEWHLMSTFRPHDPVRTREERIEAICPRCSIALPLTGVCDDCGSLAHPQTSAIPGLHPEGFKSPTF